MFEQTASLENQFKTNMSNSENIAIAIRKLSVKYQPVLTAEMQRNNLALQPCTLKMQPSST